MPLRSIMKRLAVGISSKLEPRDVSPSTILFSSILLGAIPGYLSRGLMLHGDHR